MMRQPLAWACALILPLVACAPKPGTEVGMAPSPLPSSGGALLPASPEAIASASPQPSSSPLEESAVVLGSVYALDGGALESASLRVESSSHPALNAEKQIPGVFSFRAPVGAQLRITVGADGCTPRSQSWVVRPAVGAGAESNRIDFGGSAQGQLYALVRHPEILRTQPAHGDTDVVASPLAVRLFFSKKLKLDERDLLRKLLVLELGGGAKVVPGTSYNDQRAELTWSEDGMAASFSFAAPLVTRLGEGASVRLAFDASLAEDQWPKDEAGFRLGFQKVLGARDGNGLNASTQVAPLLSTKFPSPPKVKLDAADLWALTHATSAQFSLAPDRAAPRVLGVRVVPKALADGRGEVYVRFSEAMRGYPEELLDASVTKSSAYRLVLGTTKDREPREEFEAADPQKGGIGPSEARFDPLHPEVVVLRMPVGLLERYTDFKLFIDPSVKDPGGNAVVADVDASTGRAANLIVGKVE